VVQKHFCGLKCTLISPWLCPRCVTWWYNGQAVGLVPSSTVEHSLSGNDSGQIVTKQSSSIIWYQSQAVMPYRWEGNRRPHVATDLSGLSTYGLKAQGRETSTPPTLFCWIWHSLVFTFTFVPCLSETPREFLGLCLPVRSWTKHPLRSGAFSWISLGSF